ncbi:hypothetical protein P153DRAFT_393595 [Dothidotthia symphoricarpi CBS 119687]|uniref:PhoD-like phosphatase domain-containing protein n=1 Tax=Dothidotthia symphoricarpi CBS 119687 TaxID=1392245 RepID=A0A6A6ANV6_9PLEO|nr:uncharacterized protein P153DRAFT_393595 [Dothidotthia symphoricarpi CBS 119687]KAF2132624.1 hypothetical protein P153DRAFT_393595 [Dothidotthia symphoricarpi CBS 119687]
MENSRAVNPALQRLSDPYPQKRSSQRRAADAQPTIVMAASIPSNTARVAAHRRRQSQNIPPPTSGPAHESIPAAPDVPRAPPSSYKDPYASKSGARGPPRASTRSRDPPIQINASLKQATVQTAANRLYELRSPPYAPVEPLSGTVERRSSLHTPSAPSVPDRSPLQKLEGKLDDISKEERRARILDAELAAQEKVEAEARARRAREAAGKQQRVTSQPVARSDKASSVSSRTTSSRRHVSVPVHSKPRSPPISDVASDDGYTYDMSEPWESAGARSTPAPRKNQRTPVGYQKAHHTTVVARNPSLKGKEPAGSSRGSGSFRDRTTASPAQRPLSIHRKPVASPSGLGLVGVDDTSSVADIARSGSRARSQASLASREPGSHEKRRDSRGITDAQMEMQQQLLDNKRISSHGVGYPAPPSYDGTTASANRKSVTFSEKDLQLQQPDSSHHHFRHHDVPERTYVKTPMLENWKDATIAALVSEDLDLDAPIRSTNGNPATSNQAWWEENQASQKKRPANHAEPTYDGYADEPTMPTAFNPPLYLKCGPLLRYTGLRRDRSVVGKEREIWRGSVMIVTTDAQSSYQKPPVLRLFKQPMDILPPPPSEVDHDHLDPAYIDPIEGQSKVSRTGRTLYVKAVDELGENEDLSRIEDDTGLFSSTRSPSGSGLGGKSSRIHKRDGEKLGKVREVPGVRLHAERGVTFWRFNLEVELGSSETRIAYRINSGPATGFWVPAKGESMNIMFHSCNGFSFSVETNEFCGPDPMWRDVLNNHSSRPFHVMLGGGDQIYNDAAMRQTTLFRQWTENKNPLQKHNASFSEEMQNELEQFYLDRYSMWFSQGLFGMANSQIPMVNIWDDHDIIDGYGSYPHHFMQTPVFTGIGAVAFKYYMLFQHQSVPAETQKTEPSWLLGKSPGPYIKEQSRSVFMHLGRQVAFLGLDCRTERKRDEILTEDSYDIIFDRLEDEIIKGETKHLIVLLGVPIAYPRLNFLENVLTSRLMDPIKWLGRIGLLGNYLNKFDGGVEILDDLDDHWTAKHHKEERNWFINELQHIAATKSVRITILGGDVHLAAVGQFYSNKKLNIPKDKDHRYMPNVISSAIVNTPPPDVMADVLNKRNKIHHLDDNTDEDLIPIFTHGVNGSKRNNNCLLPHRNWCSIREWKPGFTPPGTPSPPESVENAPGLTRTLSDYTPRQMVRRLSGDQTSRPGRSRGPPLSYRNNPAYAAADEQQVETQHQPQSSFSPDRSETERPVRTRRNSLTSLFRRRPSVDDAASRDYSPSTPSRNRSSASNERPSNFHRRPSVLTKRGQSTYVNLEGGLDICLNMEVSQHDPAGITMPYRLIVPALDYTASPPAHAEKQHHKPMFGGIFGGGRRERTVGDDGRSHNGSDSDSGSGSELGEMSDDDEQRANQRYQVAPRVVAPSLGSQNKRNSIPDPNKALSSGYHSNSPAYINPPQTDGAQTDRRQSIDVSHTSRSSAWESIGGKRHVSAPHPAPPTHTTTHTTTQTTIFPSSHTTRRQPSYNSSHQSQLPSEAKIYKKPTPAILTQHDDDAHFDPALAHQRSKRESYPPHPAIVGAGPNSPYKRGSLDMQARDDTGAGGGAGDYFASGGRDVRASGHAPVEVVAAAVPVQVASSTASRGAMYSSAGVEAGRRAYPSYPSAGVGGRRFDEDDSDSYDDEEDDDGESYGGRRGDRDGVRSPESFVPPKQKKKWQIWR